MLGNCEGLSNGLAIIGDEVPDISEVANRDSLFVELPFMRLKGVSKLISNDWANAGVEFRDEHDCWLRLGDFSDRGGGASGAVKEADEHVGQGSIRGWDGRLLRRREASGRSILECLQDGPSLFAGAPGPLSIMLL